MQCDNQVVDFPLVNAINYAYGIDRERAYTGTTSGFNPI